MRAERRAGELLREMERNGGARDGEQKDGPRGCITLRRDQRPKLSVFAISKSQCHAGNKNLLLCQRGLKRK
jgi:hypothetical protein